MELFNVIMVIKLFITANIIFHHLKVITLLSSIAQIHIIYLLYDKFMIFVNIIMFHMTIAMIKWLEMRFRA